MSIEKKKSALPKGKISGADNGNLRAEIALDPRMEARREGLVSAAAVGEAKSTLTEYLTSIDLIGKMPSMFDDVPIGQASGAGVATATAAAAARPEQDPIDADTDAQPDDGGDAARDVAGEKAEDIVFPEPSAEDDMGGLSADLDEDGDEGDTSLSSDPAADPALEPVSDETSGESLEDISLDDDPVEAEAETTSDTDEDDFSDVTFNRVETDTLTADPENIPGGDPIAEMEEDSDDDRSHSDIVSEWEQDMFDAERDEGLLEEDEMPKTQDDLIDAVARDGEDHDVEAAVEASEPDEDADTADYDDDEIGDILADMTGTDIDIDDEAEPAASEEALEAPDENDDFVWDQPETADLEEVEDAAPVAVASEGDASLEETVSAAETTPDDLDIGFGTDFQDADEEDPDASMEDVTTGSEDDWFKEMIADEDGEETVASDDGQDLPEGDLDDQDFPSVGSFDVQEQDVPDVASDEGFADDVADDTADEYFGEDEKEDETGRDSSENASDPADTPAPKKRGFFSRFGKKAKVTDDPAAEAAAAAAVVAVADTGSLAQDEDTVAAEVDEDAFFETSNADAVAPGSVEPDAGHVEEVTAEEFDEEDYFADLEEGDDIPEESQAEVAPADAAEPQIFFEDIRDEEEEAASDQEATAEEDAPEEAVVIPMECKKSKAPLLAASVAVMALLAGGGYLYTNPNALDGILGNQAPAPAPVIVADTGVDEPTLLPVEPEEEVTAVTPLVTENPDVVAVVPSEVPGDRPTGALEEFADDGFGTGLDTGGATDIEDMFVREEIIDPAEQARIDAEAARLEAIEVARQEEIAALQDSISDVNSRLDAMDEAFAARDRGTVERDAMLTEALETATRAEALAQAQNQIIVEVIRAQDKIAIAEQLIVDLSRRIASVEMNDPADRVTVERTVTDLNNRVEGLARDVGLVARMTINGRTGTGAGTARPTNQSRPASPGAGIVFQEGPSTMTHPNASPSNVSSDVKVGDTVDGYGKVLDLMSTSDGGKLVIMEHGSVIIPD